MTGLYPSPRWPGNAGDPSPANGSWAEDLAILREQDDNYTLGLDASKSLSIDSCLSTWIVGNIVDKETEIKVLFLNEGSRIVFERWVNHWTLVGPGKQQILPAK
jgi:hypothetical protein